MEENNPKNNEENKDDFPDDSLVKDPVAGLSEQENQEEKNTSKEPTEENDKIVKKVIEDEMKEAYINYAMSVIVGRALPNVKDGLKPVHRRILYAMYDMGIVYNKSFKKCARIVGEVLGKYHPHGDTAVYDSLVRMAQDFSLRYPLINGQGNFGSIDGDSAAAMRYCVTGDTLVLSDKGIVPIDEISNKKKEDIKINILNYEGKKKNASKFFDSGKHEIIELITNQGYKIKGSFNHPVLCWELGQFGMPNLKWKWISDLTTNDYVLLNRGYSLFSKKNPSLKKYFPKLSNRNKNITLPLEMNKQLAFFLGALVAEGSFHQNKIIFNNKDLDFYDKIKGCINNNFPETTLYEREIKGDCKELDLYHQKVVNFIKNIGFKVAKSDKKEIPHTVLKSKKEIIKEFLKGLFEGDGSVCFVKDKRHGGDSIQITYDSKSEVLISQLKVVLLNFGIVTSAPTIDKRSNCYRLVIAGGSNVNIFRKKIGFYSKRKNDILNKVKLINKNRMSKNDYIPLLNNYLRKNYSGSFIKKNNFDRYNNLQKNSERLKRILNKIDYSMVNWLLKNNYLFNKVQSVNKLKKETVYSIRVDSSCHSFVANGFINHNTESKLQKLSEGILRDIEKNTVDFKENFDGSLKEPIVLPTIIPNLLINGSSGIAVGMATNIPPHNITEVCDATIATIDNPDIDVAQLMQIVPAPDFPTGGEILCGGALKHAYMHGRGKVIIKSIVEFEEKKIVIKEVPYQVNKAEMIEQIANLVKDKKIVGIRNINDESDREGIRVVIDLKNDADEQVILNQLYKYSRMKVSFGINILALVNNQPKTLGLKDLIYYHIEHRKDVITRRTKHDLFQAEQKVHILEGLLIALNNVDEVIKGIRASRTVDDARAFLISGYSLSDLQAKAILEMRLQKLASLEQEKIQTDHNELLERIAYFKSILGSKQKILDLIKEELNEVKEKFGDKRRSKITLSEDDGDFDMEDLIEDETVVVTITNSGYIKRQPLDVYKTQKRGGKGIKATGTKEEDVVESLYIASTHNYLLCFTDKGQLYWLKVWQLPDASRQAKGKHIANVLEMKQDEKITAVVPVKDFTEGYLFMGTKQGTVKKTELMEFSKPRKGGIRAITLDEDDTLINVRYTDGEHEIILATQNGLANRFKEKDVRSMGRSARGVRGIRLGQNDEVIGMLAAEEGMNILTVTNKGFGKRTPVSEYRLCNRGGKGVTNIKITDKNGPVKVVMLVDGSEELMLVSQNGVGIRIKCSDISIIGRATQGVRIMRMNEGDELAASAKIMVDEEEINEEESSDVSCLEDDGKVLEVGDGSVENVSEDEDNSKVVSEVEEEADSQEAEFTKENKEDETEESEVTEQDFEDNKNDINKSNKEPKAEVNESNDESNEDVEEPETELEEKENREDNSENYI